MQGVLCGNVHIKYNANCFLFQKAKYAQPYTLAQPAQHSCSFLSRTSFVLAPLGLKEMEMSAMQANSIGKKIFTSQSIKPLHQAVSSPMSPHYGGLIWNLCGPVFSSIKSEQQLRKKYCCLAGCKESQFYSLSHGLAVARVYSVLAEESF